MTDPITLFDRRLLRIRRARAAVNLTAHDFLLREAALRLADRLDDITRTFPLALDLGCHHGMMREAIGPRGGIEHFIECDVSAAYFDRSSKGARIVCDEERLPFADHSFDLIVSALALHWVNDLPGALIQIRRALKPDGLFLAILPGANTLIELRTSLAHAHSRIGGSISPQVAPFVEVRDAGNLLQRAGFTLPVVDSETVTVSYENPLALMHDLRGMGETNILYEQRRTIPPRLLFPMASDYYHRHFPDAENTARIRATMEFVTLTAWSPHISQPKPAKRGSGQMDLGKFLKN